MKIKQPQGIDISSQKEHKDNGYYKEKNNNSKAIAHCFVKSQPKKISTKTYKAIHNWQINKSKALFFWIGNQRFIA